MDQHHGVLHKVIVWERSWGPPFGHLHQAKMAMSKALITRALNSLCNVSVIAVGTFKVVPFGMGENRWFSELHVIVVNADQEDLESAFLPAQPEASVRISKVMDLNETVDQVTTCNTLRLYQQGDNRPEAAQLVEFYTWLLNMKIGARLFRYGCDENFDPITDRKVKWKPRIKKNRPGRRRYHKHRKKIRRPPWVEFSDYYYD